MRKFLTLTAAAAFAVAFGFSFGAPASAQNLVAYWNFDVDGADPTLDTAPAGAVPDDGILGSTSGTAEMDDPAYDCTPANIAPTPGNVCSLDFTAADGDFVQAADSADLDQPGSYTVAAWVKLASSKTEHNVISKDTAAIPTNYNMHVLNDNVFTSVTFNAGAVLFSSGAGASIAGCDSGGCFVAGGTSVGTGAWHHVAGVYDNSTKTLTVYLDGIKDGEAVFTTGGSPTTNGETVQIGERKGNASSNLDGLIDDVRIYNRVLTDAEIAQLATTLTITKELILATEEGGGNGLIDLFEEWAFEMKVTVTNDGPGDLTGLTLKDPLPGDLEIGNHAGTDDRCLQSAVGSDVTATQNEGSVVITEKGKTKKCFVNWGLGTLTDAQSEMLTINVSTDENPGRNRRFPDGHQEYTSPGPYCINQSAAVSGTIVEVPFTQKSNGLELDNKGDPLKLRVDDDCDDFVAADAPLAPLP